MDKAKNDFIIRKAKPEDLKEILRLNLILFKKEKLEYDPSLNLSWTNNLGKEYFKKNITAKNGYIEVVEYKDRIIGYLCGRISKRLPFRKQAKYAKLENMFIEARFRNKGLGTHLAKSFLKWCKKNKVNYVSVKAYTRNQPALNLYKELGFKGCGTTLEQKL